MSTLANWRSGGKRWAARIMAIMVITAIAAGMFGCEVDSPFDPSRTGYFEHTPTLIPVLDRLDVIERDVDYLARATPVQPEDLMPRPLEYVLYPGDIVVVQIFELFSPGQWHAIERQIDASGNYRVPELGDVRAAGLTPQQFQERLEQLLHERVIRNPQVDVVVVRGGGLRYTIYGFLATPGMFTLQNPDLRLLEALAIAGGVPQSVDWIYVIRRVPLTDELAPQYGEGIDGRRPQEDQAPTSVEDLIRQLEQRDEGDGAVRPGMLQQDTDQQPPVIDIDELEPVRIDEQPPVDVDEIGRGEPRAGDASGEDTFIYDEERGEWVRVRGTGPVRGPLPQGIGQLPGEPPMVLERIIRVDYRALMQGASSQNIVIRPNDLIYVHGPRPGNVYVDGEVIRPGVYNIPATGQLTLSRLFAATGGLSPIAIPSRVDLIRRVGPNTEAVVRVDLAAIRQRTEPDIVLKPDDHIIVGTTWYATPLAVIRNGFRATYGFGFLLDRNFGNDVFGAPPDSRFD